MKPIIKDESGIAYGIYAVILMIFMGGAFLFLMTNVFNNLLTPFNSFIEQGMVSTQTRESMNFIYQVIGAMTFFLVFGVALWGWVRALEKKREEG